MKNTILLTISALIAFSTFAQSPDLFSYQAVVRDNTGKVIASKAVSLRFSINKSTATGTAQYVETHKPTTDANGLVSLMIGGGTVSSGAFSAIDWATDKYFLKVELDPTGGSSYSNMGTTQLISVPYAKHAETAKTAEVATRLAGGSPGGGSGIGAGGSADLKDFDNKFRSLARIGSGFTIKGIDCDNSGNTYMFGAFSGTLELGGVNYQSSAFSIFLAKIDSNFNVLWVKHSTGASVNGGNENHSLVVDGFGNAALAIKLRTSSSTFNWDGTTINLSATPGYESEVLIKVNQNGTLGWSKVIFPSSSDKFQTAFTSSGDLLVTGGFRGKEFFGTDSIEFSNSFNYGLIKISSNGSTIQLIDSARSAIGSGVVTDPQGNIYVSLARATGAIRLKTKTITASKSGMILKYNPAYSIVADASDFGDQADDRLLGRRLEFNGGNLIYQSRNYRFSIGNTFYSGGGSPFVIKYNASLVQQGHSVLEVTGSGFGLGTHTKSNGDIVCGNFVTGSYIIKDKSYTPLSGSDAEAAVLLTVDNSMKVTKSVSLLQFLDANGFYVSGSNNTTFFASDIAGSFYNHGTKYTPGVYLFKE